MQQPSRMILVVDDSPEECELYRRYLQQDPDYSYRIWEASLGRQGLELWQQQQPDLVLLKYRLPDLDGLEFLAQLPSPTPQPCLPVIVITDQGNETIALQAVKAGAQDYLITGQITPERLHLTIHRAIETVQIRTELHQRIEREQVVNLRQAELYQQSQTELAERQRVEAELRQSEERLRISHELSLYAFTTLDSLRDESGKIIDFVWTYVNPKAAEILKRPIEELIGKRLLQVLPGNKLNSELFERYVRIVETGEPDETELSYTADGITGWFRNMTVKLKDGIAIVFSDITGSKQAEADLITTNNILQAVINGTDDVMFVKDLQGRYVLANQAAARWLNRTVEDMLGEDDSALFLADVAQRLQAVDQRVIQSGESMVYDELMLREGEMRSLLSRKYPWRNQQGEIVGVIGISSDITARKQMEAHQKQQKAELNQAQQIGNIGSWYWDAKTDVTIGSDQLLRIYGFDPDIDTMPNFSDQDGWLYPHESWATINAGVQRALETGIGYDLEVQAFRNGTPIWITTRCEVVRDSDGMIIGLRGTVQDITARKQTEQTLRHNEQLLRLALEGAQAGSWSWNLTTGELTWSAETYKLYGLDPANPLPEYEGWYESCLHPDDRSWVNTELARMIDQRLSLIQIEFRIVHPERGIRWLLGLGRLLLNEQGEPIQLNGINLDITHRKQSEEMLRCVAEQDAFRVALTDALRSLGDPVEIQATASRLLGEYLGVNRVAYFQVRGTDYFVERDYVNGAESLLGGYPIDSFGPRLLAAYRTGRAVSAADVAADPNLSPDQRSAYAAIQIAAYIGVPLVKNEEFVAGLAIHSATPRAWTAQEVSLVEEVAERTWAAVQRARAETALRASEAKYRSLFDSIDEGFCIIEMIDDDAGETIDFCFLEVNSVYEQQTGLENPSGQLVSDISPNIESFWLETFDRVARTGEPLRFENYHEDTGRWYGGYASRLGGVGSRQVAIVFDDITDRKWRERQQQYLLKLNDALRPLCDAAQIEATACRLLGEDLGVDRVYYPMLHEEGYWQVEREYKRGTSPSMVGNYPASAYSWALPFLRRGDPVIVEDIYHSDIIPSADVAAMAAIQTSAITVPLIKGGALVGAFSVTEKAPRVWQPQEVELVRETAERTWAAVERARAEAALQASHATFRHLVENSPFGVYVVDADFRMAQVSTGARKAFAGVRPLIGRDLAEVLCILWPEPFVSEAITHFQHTLATGETYQTSTTLERRQDINKVESYDWKIERITLPDGRFGVVCHFYDLSERQQLLQREQAARGEAERANRIKDEFLAIVSHELRSPLNPILGWTKLLQTRKFDPAKTAEALATIERNAKLQTQLIDDLLDVAKILRGKLSMNVAPVDLAFVIEAAIDTVRTAAVAKEITLHAVLPQIGRVSGDSARLQQIVWNLLSNAIKFTPAKGQVEVRLERDGNQAKITFSDTGKGINRDFMPHIFESFRQEDASTTRQYGGLGLGLAIVRHLVEAHGGTICADSPGEGQGATFIVQLPLLDAESQQPTSFAVSIDELDLIGVRILAVDDEPDARELLTALLTQYGAEVLTVTCATEVLTNLESFQPDVLISDIGMPDVDGYILMEQIRALPPEKGGEILAIALTAYARVEDYQQARASGYQRHLTKPLDLDQLVQVVAELTDLSHCKHKPTATRRAL